MNNIVNDGRNKNDYQAEAFEAACRLPVPALVRELVEVLGSGVVAAVGNVRNTRSIYQWMSGEREPDRLDVLRFAVQLVFMMRAAGEGDPAIGAWFTGVNPRLGDEKPVSVLGANGLDAVSAKIVDAARAFIRQ